MRDRLKLLVADDEEPARLALALQLAQDEEVEVVAVCEDGPAALRAIEQLKPDVAFLDLRMPGLDGMDVVRAIGERRPQVVFVTAFSDRAVEAFAVEAVDYVLKPFDDQRLSQALERAKRAARAASTEPVRSWLGQLTVTTSRGLKIVPSHAIDWIGAQDYYAEVHVGAESFLVRQSLTQLAGRMDPTRFIRAHRSAIVNLERVVEVKRSLYGDGTLVLADGQQLPLSRRYRRQLLELLAR